MVKKTFTAEEAKEIGEKLGIRWDTEDKSSVSKNQKQKFFDVEQFRRGMDVELEHGTVNKLTNVTNDNALMTGKIALAHLNEFSDYYIRLHKMEKEADKFWASKVA